MYPVAVDVDYEIDRNRLTTFFRPIIALPWIIVGYLYGIVATLAIIGAWVAMLFTKRYPESLYRFISGYLRFSGRVTGFVALATDELPSFSGQPDPAYPVHIDVAPAQPEYSRAKTFFKIVLAFPQQILAYGLTFVLYGAAFVTWWRVLFTGKQSVTMHDAIRATLAYVVRANGFIYLLTEEHPRLLELPQQQLPPDAPAMPALPPGGGTPAPVAPTE